ncbi:MAG: carbohydrate ABC transporter permease, partial [Anaerolineae bacterium]|nr:carbohydrate ABC transporter permease [Anaerolineae bacterium]
MARRLGVFRVLVHAVLIVGAVVSLFPFGWMILTSFKSYREVATGAVFPSVWRFSNYVEAWQSAPFARYFLNSIIMAASTVLGVLLTSTLAAYAFARLEFVGKNAIFNLFLATMMIPGAITLIPNFITIQRLGWYDTYLALIVPWTASVFSIFLLRQFFAQIPRDLYDAALLDGCGHLRSLP